MKSYKVKQNDKEKKKPMLLYLHLLILFKFYLINKQTNNETNK